MLCHNKWEKDVHAETKHSQSIDETYETWILVDAESILLALSVIEDSFQIQDQFI